MVKTAKQLQLCALAKYPLSLWNTWHFLKLHCWHMKTLLLNLAF